MHRRAGLHDESPDNYGRSGSPGKDDRSVSHNLPPELAEHRRTRFACEQGQTMAEYGVVLSIAVTIVITALIVLRVGIIDALGSVVPYL
jgi:hypothetical protein